MHEMTAAKAIEQFKRGCIERFKKYYAFLQSEGVERIYIYGSGVYGRFLKNALLDFDVSDHIDAFINDYENGGDVEGIPVLSYAEIDRSDDKYCIIIGIQNADRLVMRLEEQGVAYNQVNAKQKYIQDMLMYYVYRCIPIVSQSDAVGKIEYYHDNLKDKKDEIVSFYDDDVSRKIISDRLSFYETGEYAYLEGNCTLPEYFCTDYMSFHDHETYVDCGAYDGDTVLSFADFVGGQYEKIIAFEPDLINYKKLTERTSGLKNIELYPYATGRENCELRFEETGGLGAYITSEGKSTVKCVSLDSFIKEKVSLIKMDIEGAELDTLKGAEELIREQTPKLIICVYHKGEDILMIPQYLRTLCPEYHFRIRQHEESMLELVLYAEKAN